MPVHHIHVFVCNAIYTTLHHYRPMKSKTIKDVILQFCLSFLGCNTECNQEVELVNSIGPQGINRIQSGCTDITIPGNACLRLYSCKAKKVGPGTSLRRNLLVSAIILVNYMPSCTLYLACYIQSTCSYPLYCKMNTKQLAVLLKKGLQHAHCILRSVFALWKYVT